ncbi:probable glutathione S-transferase GSTU6 [Lolium rigidum]|jgi:glutathione S-transferase|uniref:probable glutathione S-transferase GSTU6 n=1 Tax=Lolium rigidum TaxID=89674 RepID=UPI001F5DFEDF|nr:probable glutathione S-transferase GSTU6 [Lolium rigidum]XP_051223410.1 probable glutathione S-transferase GSTU6 [Lolium perenne]
MAGGDDLKLLGTWASPFAIRVKLALALKGLSYEYTEEDLASKSELLLSSNPVHKKIPVLIHNGVPVCESNVIVEYVDEAFAGPSILSADPYKRAIARFWAAYVDDKLLASWATILFRGKTEEEKSEGKKALLAALDTLEGALAKCSDGKGFFGGDSVGLVDMVLGSQLSWLKATEVITGEEFFCGDKTPLLAAWMARFSELDAAKAALPDVDKVVEFAKMRQARMAATAAAASNN